MNKYRWLNDRKGTMGEYRCRKRMLKNGIKVRKDYLKFMRENHPDRRRNKGLPPHPDVKYIVGCKGDYDDYDAWDRLNIPLSRTRTPPAPPKKSKSKPKKTYFGHGKDAKIGVPFRIPVRGLVPHYAVKIKNGQVVKVKTSEAYLLRQNKLKKMGSAAIRERGGLGHVQRDLGPFGLVYRVVTPFGFVELDKKSAQKIRLSAFKAKTNKKKKSPSKKKSSQKHHGTPHVCQRPLKRVLKKELLEVAKKMKIKGRHALKKEQLRAKICRKKKNEKMKSSSAKKPTRVHLILFARKFKVQTSGLTKSQILHKLFPDNCKA